MLVGDLLSALRDWEDVPAELIDHALELDKVYIGARYPSAHAQGSAHSRYTQDEAVRLIGYAETIIAFCQGLLSRLDKR